MDVCNAYNVRNYLVEKEVVPNSRAIDLRDFFPPEGQEKLPFFNLNSGMARYFALTMDLRSNGDWAKQWKDPVTAIRNKLLNYNPSTQQIEIHGIKIKVLTDGEPLSEPRLLMLIELFHQINPEILKKINENWPPLKIYIGSPEKLKDQVGFLAGQNVGGKVNSKRNIIYISTGFRSFISETVPPERITLRSDDGYIDGLFFLTAAHELGHVVFSNAIEKENPFYWRYNSFDVGLLGWGTNLFRELFYDYPAPPIWEHFSFDYYLQPEDPESQKRHLIWNGSIVPNEFELFAYAFEFLQYEYFRGRQYDFEKSEKKVAETGDRCLMAAFKTLRIVDAFLKTGDPEMIKREMLRRIPEEF